MELKRIFGISMISFLVTSGILANDDRALLVNQLKYQTGQITLPGNMAMINVKKGYKFLNQKQAKIVLEKIWGNPEGDDLGLLVPSDFNPLADNSWAIVVSFSEDGYINDKDAESIDYTKLLKDMQKETVDANKERQKKEFPTVELVGWATPPRYDNTTHKMVWAKELKFEGDDDSTLNYNIRILGRKGVLVLNAVAGMNNLKTIEAETPEILSMVNFTSGNKYSDYNKDTDKIAEYGIAALVAGGLAAKVGLFKGLWLALLAFKKFILYGLVLVGGAISSFLKKKKKSTES